MCKISPVFRNLAVRQFLANANARPAPLQDPAGQGADPARVRAAAHHGRRAAGVAEPAPALPVPARLPGGPVLTPVVAEVPEGETLTLRGGGGGSVVRGTDGSRGPPPTPAGPCRPQGQLLFVSERLPEAGGARCRVSPPSRLPAVDSRTACVPQSPRIASGVWPPSHKHVTLQAGLGQHLSTPPPRGSGGGCSPARPARPQHGRQGGRLVGHGHHTSLCSGRARGKKAEKPVSARSRDA